MTLRIDSARLEKSRRSPLYTPIFGARPLSKYRRAVQREPSVADVVAARRVVDRYLPRAPLERSPLLSSELGADIHLKIETFKPTRTFKVRGALNKIASLNEASRRRGVVAASAGSHAQGVAYAASALGAPATVVMPRGVSDTIVRVCRAYGADVLLEGSVYDDTLALAHRIEQEQGKTFIHPYADPLIVAGQGTIGLEILDDLPGVELVVVAVGGGGLITGIALALRSALPGVRVVGVEPEGADAVGRSVRAGHPITLESPHSVADKLVAKSTDALNVTLAARYVDEFVTVSDADLERASYEYLEGLSLLVEPSGAAPLAAVRAGKIDPHGRKTVLVVSGGNATPALIARIVAQRDATAAGAGAPEREAKREEKREATA
jgi:threonine dehydratase